MRDNLQDKTIESLRMIENWLLMIPNRTAAEDQILQEVQKELVRRGARIATKYIVIPASAFESGTGYWDTIFDYAWDVHRITGNDFIGCRDHIASTGGVAIKLDRH